MLGFKFLAGRDVLPGQKGVAGQIGQRDSELRLILLLLGVRRIQGGLIRTGIDNSQQIALLDILAFFDRYPGQGTIDAWPDLNREIRLHRTQPAQPDRHIAPDAVVTVTGTACG